MRWVLVSVVAVLGIAMAAAAAQVANAPEPSAPSSVEIYGAITGKARAQLAAAWDDVSPQQVERAYCVSQAEYQIVTTKSKRRLVTILVDSIQKPDTVAHADPKQIVYRCPAGKPTLHIHTPTSCYAGRDGNVDTSTCVLGGIGAWFCGFSEADLQSFVQSRLLFHVVQCDRNAFVFWWSPQLYTL